MSDTIENEKFVELNYKVVDEKTGDVLVTVIIHWVMFMVWRMFCLNKWQDTWMVKKCVI